MPLRRYYAILVGCDKLSPKIAYCTDQLTMIKDLVKKEGILGTGVQKTLDLDDHMSLVEQVRLTGKEWGRLYGEKVRCCSCENYLYIVGSDGDLDDLGDMLNAFEYIQY